MSLHVDQQNTYQQIIVNLSNLLNIENPTLQPNPHKPQKHSHNNKDNDIPLYVTTVSYGDALQHYNKLYHQYVALYKQLNNLHDQLLHVQQHQHCTVLLQLIVVRIVQCYEESRKLGQHNGEWTSDYPIQYNNVIPEPHLPLPLYTTDMLSSSSITARQLIPDNPAQSTVTDTLHNNTNIPHINNTMTISTALNIIQKLELVRQAKFEYLTRSLQYNAINQLNINNHTGSGVSERLEPNQAAVMIQRLYRGYCTRKSVARYRYTHSHDIGILYHESINQPGEAQIKLIREQRKIRQSQLQLQYREILRELQSELRNDKYNELNDAMWDERYAWYIQHKLSTGKYPSNFNGFYDEKNKHDQIAVQPIVENKSKSSRGNTTAAPSKSSAQQSAVTLSIDKSLITISTSSVVNELYNSVRLYHDVWLSTDNTYIQPALTDFYDKQLALNELLPGITYEIERGVDERLSAHLAQITAQFIKPKHKKKLKKQSASKPKTSHSSQSTGTATDENKVRAVTKKKKSIKLKSCCDIEKPLQPVITDYIQVLMKWNILIDKSHYAMYTFDSYYTDCHSPRIQHNVVHTTDATISNMQASINDIKDALLNYSVLPLSSNIIHSQCSSNLTSILLYGAQGSGKRHLTYAVVNSLNAVLFDISINKIKYRLTNKLEIYRLLHIIFYVALQVQPSILYISDVELLCPAALKHSNRVSTEIDKYRTALLQHITYHCTLQNQLQVIGNINEPISDTVDTQQLLTIFPLKSARALYIPLPTYTQRLYCIQKFLNSHHANIHQNNTIKARDINLFSYISDGYTIGSIQQVIDQLCRSAARDKKNTITMNELLYSIANQPMIYSSQYDRYVQFNSMICGEKERRRINEIKNKLSEVTNTNTTNRIRSK